MNADLSHGRLRLVWLPDGAEEGRELVVDGDAGVEVVAMPAGGPVPPGRYVRLPWEQSVAIHPSDPMPTFLHEGLRVFEKSWIEELATRSDEVKVADSVYRKVRDLVERELPTGARPIGPTFTMSYTDDLGRDMVRGTCVLVKHVPV